MPRTAKAGREFLCRRARDFRASLARLTARIALNLRGCLFGEKPLRVRIGDVYFEMVPAGETALRLWSNPAYRQDELRCLARLLRPDSVFISIGSEAGLYALAGARLASVGKIYVFESRPQVFEILKKNVALNRADHIVCVNALPATPAERDGKKRFVPGQATAAKPVDEFIYVNGIERIDAIRVAADGAEWMVLRGAEKLLRRTGAPVVFYESGFATRAYGYHPVEIMWYLEKLGYAIFVPYPGDGRLIAQKAEYGYAGTRVAVKVDGRGLVLPGGMFR